MIQSLIDKKDTFEIVRDRIAEILVLEVANQMSLATAAGKDPNLWKLRIFTERSNPWEQWLNPTDTIDKSPIINIWYDNSNFDLAKSDIIQRQSASGIYNIDCYGYGVGANNIAGGHIAGDELAAFEVQRALRLVRNILMASENAYLKLRGTVSRRWPQSMNTFQPSLDNRTIQNVGAARVAFNVNFNEFSPQYEPEILELITTTTFRAETGEILINANYGG